MADFGHVSEPEAEKLYRIARRAKASLRNFGFRANNPPDTSDVGGAVVEVDTGDDPAGGVHVRWSLPKSVNEEVVRHVVAGEVEHPSIAQAEAISDLMSQVIVAVLVADGFDARISDDGMNAGFIDILSAPSER